MNRQSNTDILSGKILNLIDNISMIFGLIMNLLGLVLLWLAPLIGTLIFIAAMFGFAMLIVSLSGG